MTKFQVFALAAASAGLMAMIGAAAQPESGAQSVAPPKVLSTCQKCHGVTGSSPIPIYPRLNGQHAQYLEAQLKAFRGHRRDDTRARGYMWVQAHNLDDKTIDELAKYFSSQKPTPPQTGGALASEGEKLYRNGDPAKGIVACQECHGKDGNGSGSVPRIAGQHAYYFRMVMGGFHSGLRKNKMMRSETKHMTDRQIYALSSYLANE